MVTVPRIGVRVVAAGAVLAVSLTGYVAWARPYQLHWGATAQEVAQAMPGDALDPHPTFLATRAITINATAAQIWPWLVQMGYGRAGFYGYDLIENLGSPRGLASADRIEPQFQDLHVGDIVPISGVAQLVVSTVEPGRYLVWAGQSGPDPGSFAWALYPVDATHTRLVSRIRWHHHSLTQPGLLALDAFTEFTDHLAVRKILAGVKGRAEGHHTSAVVADAQVALFSASAVALAAGLGLILGCALTWRRWVTGLAAGATWLLVWYSPLPGWVGDCLLAGVLVAGYRAFHRPAA